MKSKARARAIGRLPRPPGVCQACFGATAVVISGGRQLAVHCEHEHVGAVATITAEGRGLWQTFSPVDRREFEAWIERTQADIGDLIRRQAKGGAAPGTDDGDDDG